MGTFNERVILRIYEFFTNNFRWGNMVHGCPGKLFALNEIKTACIFFIMNFDLIIENPNEIIVDYFAPKAFSEKKITCKLRLVEN